MESHDCCACSRRRRFFDFNQLPRGQVSEDYYAARERAPKRAAAAAARSQRSPATPEEDDYDNDSEEPTPPEPGPITAAGPSTSAWILSFINC